MNRTTSTTTAVQKPPPATPTITIAISRPRQREHEVDPPHHYRVDHATDVAREQSEDGGDRECADCDDRRAEQRRARADDRARQNVATEQVRSREVLVAGGRDAQEQVLGVRWVRGDLAPEDRTNERDEDECSGDPHRHRYPSPADDSGRRDRRRDGAGGRALLELHEGTLATVMPRSCRTGSVGRSACTERRSGRAEPPRISPGSARCPGSPGCRAARRQSRGATRVQGART